MEKNHFNIDRLLRSKLSRPADGPDDAARNVMEKMLRDAAHEKKKRRGFWWFFLLAGLSGLCWGIWSMNSSLSDTNITPSNQNSVLKEGNTDHDTTDSEKPVDTDSNSNSISEVPQSNNEEIKESIPGDLHAQDPSIDHAKNATYPSTKKEPQKTKVTSGRGQTSEVPVGNQDKTKSQELDSSTRTAYTEQPENIISENKKSPVDSSIMEQFEEPEKSDTSINNTSLNEIKNETSPSDSIQANMPADSTNLLATDSITNQDTLPIIKPKLNSWEATAGIAWSKFSILDGALFAKSDRETMSALTGLSPDFSIRRNFNRIQVGMGYSSFKFEKSISEDSIRVADGQLVIIDDEITTDEYYYTDLDEKLRQFNAITNFTSRNFRLQGGFNLLKDSRFQLTPCIGIEYQRSKYEALSYYRYGFYMLVEGSDPVLDFYHIWHEKRRTTYSNWMLNGLGSIEFNAIIWRNIFLSFEPVVHYPLKSNNSDYQKTIRFDAKFSIGFRLMK
jgi:hypothetical protein